MVLMGVNLESSKAKTIRLRDMVTLFLLMLFIFVFYIYFIPRTLGLRKPFAVVESESMEPTIHIGDILVAVKPYRLKVGDIILYSRGFEGELICHRIIEIKNIRGRIEFITKGDRNPLPDPLPVLKYQVRGKVVLKIPLAGYLTLLFSRK